MKQLMLTGLTFFSLGMVSGQNRFTILGKNNLLKNGKAIFTEIAPAGFYTSPLPNDTVTITNGTFTLNGNIKKPQQYRLILINDKKKHITEPFFIDKGLQEITVDSSREVNFYLDFGYHVSVKGSKANKEYITQLLPRFAPVNKKFAAVYAAIEASDSLPDSLQKQLMKEADIKFKEYRRQRDSILVQYAIEHPSSPITPWYLYNRIRKFGYNNYYQQATDIIAKSIPPAMANLLTVYLNSLKSNTEGNTFPLLGFIKEKVEKKYVDSSKYLLVEFWFSSCAPCIGQFEQLRPIYAAYHTKGFEILAIATDTKATSNKYHQLLKAKDYPWVQLLDIAGTQSQTMDIHQYPSSFLLDKKGKIIMRNIQPATLKDFLEDNL